MIRSANLTFNIGGALTTTGDASFSISNNNDGSGGGTIGSDATINVSAASISAGGALFANIINLAGGSIVGSANINFNLAGDLTTVGDANATLSIAGGTIGSDAGINVTANNVSTWALLLPRLTTVLARSVARSVEAPISRLISAANWPRRATRSSRSITPMVE